MREACHHNLYAIANSQAMNGIGPNTSIRRVMPVVIPTVAAAAAVMSVLFMICLVKWAGKVRKFKKTETYASYKAYRKTLKK